MFELPPPRTFVGDPRKSKPTKLCPLVGSGILKIDHPKDQPLCSWSTGLPGWWLSLNDIGQLPPGSASAGADFPAYYGKILFPQKVATKITIKSGWILARVSTSKCTEISIVAVIEMIRRNVIFRRVQFCTGSAPMMKPKLNLGEAHKKNPLEPRKKTSYFPLNPGWLIGILIVVY